MNLHHHLRKKNRVAVQLKVRRKKEENVVKPLIQATFYRFLIVIMLIVTRAGLQANLYICIQKDKWTSAQSDVLYIFLMLISINVRCGEKLIEHLSTHAVIIW